MNSGTSTSICATPRMRSPVAVQCPSAPSINTRTPSASTTAGRLATGTTVLPNGQKPSPALKCTPGR